MLKRWRLDIADEYKYDPFRFDKWVCLNTTFTNHLGVWRAKNCSQGPIIQIERPSVIPACNCLFGIEKRAGRKPYTSVWAPVLDSFYRTVLTSNEDILSKQLNRFMLAFGQIPA